MKIQVGDIYKFEEDIDFKYIRIIKREKMGKALFFKYNALHKDMTVTTEMSLEDTFKRRIKFGFMLKCGISDKDVAKFLLLGL